MKNIFSKIKLSFIELFFKKPEIRVVGPCVILPPDASRIKETRLYLGCIAVNGWKLNSDWRWWKFWKPKFIEEPVTESWCKTSPVPIQFKLNTSQEDTILDKHHSSVSHSPGNDIPANSQ